METKPLKYGRQIYYTIVILCISGIIYNIYTAFNS